MPDGALKVTLPPSQKLNDEALLIVAVGSAFFVTDCELLNELQPSELVTWTA
jgi:hypothetical protein